MIPNQAHGRQYQYSRHALERMFQRNIRPDTVERIAEEGRVIATYPDDQPYPSKLILGFEENTPIHIVLADMPTGDGPIIVTVYQPDPTLWNATFTSRRSK